MKVIILIHNSLLFGTQVVKLSENRPLGALCNTFVLPVNYATEIFRHCLGKRGAIHDQCTVIQKL